MHSIGKKIVFGYWQIKKGNSKKSMKNELEKCLRLFKSLPDNNEFDEVFNYLFENKVTTSLINANMFPANMKLFGKYKEIGFSDNLKYELRWHMKCLSAHKILINQFIEKKMQIDQLILLNQYKEALELLEALEYQIGLSYWLLENKIFLWNKLEMNIQTEFIKNLDSNVLSTILSFYNMRCSDEVSSRDYDYFTRKEISRFKRINPDAKKIISFYNYMIAPFSFDMSDNDILYISSTMNNMPLIDRYLCIIDLCEYILNKSKNEEYRRILKECIYYMEEISDSIVEVFRFMLDTKENRLSNYNIQDPLMPIKNKYIAGDIEECYQDITKRIKENPSIASFNLYIEVCQLLGKNPAEIEVSDNIKMILKNLNSIYSIDDRYNDAIDAVYKLSFSCIHAGWARDAYNNIIRRSLPYKSEEQKIAVKYTNIQKLTIETVCENLLLVDAIDYLENFELSDDLYVVFWKNYILGNINKSISKCGLEPLRILLQLKNSKDFADFQRELIDNNEIISLYKIRYTKVMWDNMNFETYIEEGIDYFLHLFIQREDIVIIAPMQKFVDYYLSTDTADKSNIRVPILYYIYTTYFEAEKRDHLSIICEDFFYYNNIDRPSLMQISNNKYPKDELVFFLRYICIPQIMGPVLLSIRSSKALDQERINTCQYLRTLDPDNESIYEQEIRDTTHKLFINEGLNSIENSKIHVNTEGIKSKISKNLKSAFNNYLYYRNHAIDLVLETIKNMEGGERYQIITLDTSQIFNEIVYTIRNEFVSSGEYGLDGYLSLNIRHGTLSAQLRAPLAKFKLLTTYMVETEGYAVEEKWLDKVKSQNERNEISKAIIEFNKETDNIINNLKATLIQISTEEKPSEGIFKYELDESNMKTLQMVLTENCEFEDFIDKVFDYLWNITENNLEIMKIIIREDVSQKYIKAFAKLSTVIKKVNSIYPFPEALRWLNEAQNEIDAQLEKICNWFKRSAVSQHADFDLDLALQIGFKMIQNIHPEKLFEIKDLKKDLSLKISGTFLKNYWDIFYTLFDNVSKYALLEEGKKKIYCDLKVDSTGIYIKMSNAYDCSNNLSDEINKLDTALSLISDTAYLARAKQEGGSGIPKIYKILSIDLDKKAKINYKFLLEENLFTIEIEGKNK